MKIENCEKCIYFDAKRTSFDDSFSCPVLTAKCIKKGKQCHKWDGGCNMYSPCAEWLNVLSYKKEKEEKAKAYRAQKEKERILAIEKEREQKLIEKAKKESKINYRKNYHESEKTKKQWDKWFETEEKRGEIRNKIKKEKRGKLNFSKFLIGSGLTVAIISLIGIIVSVDRIPWIVSTIICFAVVIVGLIVKASINKSIEEAVDKKCKGLDIPSND